MTVANPSMEHAWYSEGAGFFGHPFLDEYRLWMTRERSRKQALFVVGCLGLDAGSSTTNILDLGCGDGRHTIELRRQGFSVTGLDLNRWLLGRAVSSAEAAGVAPCWVAADMRSIPFRRAFDAVLSLFTSFGFFPHDSEDAGVIQQVANSLRPGGRFILDVMNRDFVLHHLKEVELRQQADGFVWTHRRQFDPVTNRLHHRRSRTDAAGESSWESIVRLYSREELEGLCRREGLRVRQIYGGYEFESAGVDHPRTIVVAENPE